jgi:hypothetical protein
MEDFMSEVARLSDRATFRLTRATGSPLVGLGPGVPDVGTKTLVTPTGLAMPPRFGHGWKMPPVLPADYPRVSDPH